MKRLSAVLTALSFMGCSPEMMDGHDPADYSGPAVEFAMPVVRADALATEGWTPGSFMTAPHNAPSTALLPDGRVLLVGGYDYTTSTHTRTCELYDPSTNTWTKTAPLNGPGRWSHTVTLLKDGRVLVAGGSNSTNLRDAELYDPSTGTWTVTGSMAYTRQEHTATLLPDGRVLVVGGNAFSLIPAEIYDPVTGVWSLAGTPAEARGDLAARLLPNGKVLITGGSRYPSTCPTRSELFDPVTGTWSVAGSLNTGRMRPIMELLPDGKLVIMGGRSCSGTAIGSAELYDPATDTWTYTRSLNQARQYSRSVTLASGKVLIAGGSDSNGTYLTSAEVFDPATLSFTLTPPMNYTRVNFGINRLYDGRVLIAGTQGLTTDIYTEAPIHQQAAYDATLQAPACTGAATSCDTGTLVDGRAALGPESNAPNTLARSCEDATYGTYHSDESLDRVRVSTVDDTLLSRGKSVRVEATVWAYAGYSSDYLDIFYATDASAPVWQLITTLSPVAAGAQTLSTTFTLANTGGRHAIRAQFRYMGSATPCSAGSWNDRDDLAFDVQ